MNENTITITAEEYARLIRRSTLLDVIMAVSIDTKSYMSDLEKAIVRVKKLTDDQPEEAEESEGDDA